MAKEKQANRIGYARTSSKDQHLDRQILALQDVSKLFSDKLSGRTVERPQFQAMMAYIREGDIVVVTELDRLGRNNKELTDSIDTIRRKGATLEVLNLPHFSNIEDENLRLFLTNLVIEIYKYQAENDLQKIRERQEQGIEIAKGKGKYTGRKPKFTENDPRLQHAFTLYQSGMSDKEAANLTGISRATFIRYRKKFGIQRKEQGENVCSD